MKKHHLFLATAAGLGFALAAGQATMAAEAASAEDTFLQYCAACHLEPPTEDIPTLAAISQLGANGILAAMESGVMRIQAQALSDEQKVMVAEYIAGDTLQEVVGLPTEGLCTGPLSMQVNKPGPAWNGWGAGPVNNRYREDETAINRDNVDRLTLKWAFGIANATQARSQPALVDGVLYMASQTGQVYALDAESGCTFWAFQAGAGVRSAISVGDIGDDTGEQAAIFFTDATATAYAVDAISGELLWRRKVDEHPSAAATGSPTYHKGVLYVPVSGVSEESAASGEDYECCTFRGSVSALDAASGEVLWKTYMVDEPQPRGVNEDGTQLWGPAGVAIWSAPTVDEERNRIYVATGNAYADPPPPTSDAIVALDMETGAMEWVQQATNDVWIMGCDENSPGGGPDAANNPNCPGELGPDFDFSASPVLATLEDGSQLLIATQKSGMSYAFDPDNDGALVWEYRWGAGSPAGGVWGAAVDHEKAYFAVGDMFSPVPGGMRAVQLATGEEIWSMGPPEAFCGEPGEGCNAAQNAAVTAVPGLLMSGANDGGIRIYDTESGEILWSFDSAREFETVNGVTAKGGSIDGPGPIVVNGMMYVTSGNAGFFGTGGNVLLAFAIDDE